MPNRIVTVDVITQRLDPFEAELRVVVSAEQVTATTELRGRFVGPKSAISSTIEVAYPLRPLPRNRPGELTARVVIPEPSRWERDCPFEYDGVVELWQDGERVDVRPIRGYRLPG
jgi:hypothetical protein